MTITASGLEASDSGAALIRFINEKMIKMIQASFLNLQDKNVKPK